MGEKQANGVRREPKATENTVRRFPSEVGGGRAQRDGGGSREALIKSLFDYTLVFSCNTRNNPTRIASYLKQQSCIGPLRPR